MEVAFAEAGDVTIAYQGFGRRGDPAVLLVMGVGAQMIGWDEEFCSLLAARGLFVVRFDNRDTGASTHFTHAKPDLAAAAGGDRTRVAYVLEDMADDVTGLADALGLDGFHVVGVSLGGMVAQAGAARHPARVRSLTSIMSSPSPDLQRATPEALAVLLGAPPATRAEHAERAVFNARVLASPGYPIEEERIRDKALRAYDRGIDPPGVGRQMAAALASGDRTATLRDVRIPTLVLHGQDDPLIHVSGGHATAAAIAGAQLEVLSGMGHDLPAPLWPHVIDRIADVVARGEATRAEVTGE